MHSGPLVVSFASRDGVYDRYLSRLEQSCAENGLRFDFELVAAGRREDIVRQKPSFIAKMLERHSEPVVWLDADAVVIRPFVLPDGDWDLGFVPNTLRNMRHAFPVASFVVAAAPTIAAQNFLATWNYLCQWDGSPHGDHSRLQPTRLLQRKLYNEIDLVRPLKRAIVRDLGRDKENTIESDPEFYWRRALRRVRLSVRLRRAS